MPSASVAYADGPRSVNIVESSSATSTLATESFCMVRRCPELLDWLSAHPEAAMAPFTTETQLAQSLCVAAAACLARLRAPGAGHERRVQCRSVIYRSPDEGNYSHAVHRDLDEVASRNLRSEGVAVEPGGEPPAAAAGGVAL